VVVFDEAGNYSLTLTVWNLNGSTDTTAFDIVVAGGYLPYYKETFEIQSFSADSWKVENPDDEITWELFSTGGTGPGNTAAGINFAEYYTIGQRDRLISPTFNLTGLSSAALEFQHAYAKRHDEVTDSLIVYVSGDCGENWTRVFAAGEDGSGNFATHEQTTSFWPEQVWDWCGFGYGASCISIDLTPWAGQANIRFAFESVSGYGNPMFIDNVQISQFVGLAENISEQNEINVYPNPTNGSFFVEWNGDDSYTEISLFNQMGQLIQTKKIEGSNQATEFKPGNDQKPGVYFIRLSGERKTVTKRIVRY
jgi:hypothetical protein